MSTLTRVDGILALVDHRAKRLPNGPWKAMHCHALLSCKGIGVIGLIRSLASIVDHFHAHGSRGTTDSYFADDLLGMICAARHYLNFDQGRLDCGTLDRAIRFVALRAGFDPDSI